MAITALALALAWQVVRVNVFLYDADAMPRLAELAPAGRPDRDVLIAVLHDNPSDVAALALLARGHDAESRTDVARRVYAAALALAPLDRELLGAAAEFFLRRGSTAEGFALLARLADNYAEVRPKVFPVLADLLATQRDAPAWNALIARNPSWLGEFVAAACNYAAVDPGGLVPLLRARAPAAPAACVIERLRAAQRWDEAYQVWLNTLPRERLSAVGFVYNGSFEFAPSGVGFDWIPTRRAEREVGHSVELKPTAGAVGNQALRVSYNGKRQAGSPIAQYLALPAGRYELRGLARAENLQSVRGTQWTVRCAGPGKDAALLAASERFIGSSDWRRFAFAVNVPKSCRGQVLQLEPVGVEDGATFLSGSLWFDDLALRRLSAAN